MTIKAAWTGPADRWTGPRAANVVISVYLLCIAAMVAAFQFPPILDYANHYARLWLIAGGIDRPPLSDMYALEWNRTATNLGIDLVTKLAGKALGIDLLARVFLFCAIVLPPLGAILLHRKLFGGSYLWQVAILFCSWCSTMIGGFINFQIGLGLALILARVDLSIREKGTIPAFAWRLVAGLFLTLTHIFGAGFFMVLVCALEFPADLRRHGMMATVAKKLLLAVVATMTAPIYMLLSTESPPADYQGNYPTVWIDSLGLLARNLLSGIATYNTAVDILFILPVAVVVLWAVLRRRCRIHGGLLVGAAGLLFLSLISPTHILGTGWISWRFPIMTGLVFMAMICPFPAPTTRQAVVLLCLLSVAVFGRTAWIGYNWWESEKDVADLMEALKRVEPGSAVLPAIHEQPWEDLKGPSHRFYAGGHSTAWHVPTLAVPFAHAFVPTMFAARGKQPLTVLAPWSEIAVQDGAVIVTVAALMCPSIRKVKESSSPYLARWHERFDYVLVVAADLPDAVTGFERPYGTSVIYDGDFAELYRIDRSVPVDLNVATSPNCPP